MCMINKYSFKDIPVGCYFTLISSSGVFRFKKTSDWLPLDQYEVETSPNHNCVNYDNGHRCTFMPVAKISEVYSANPWDDEED